MPKPDSRGKHTKRVIDLGSGSHSVCLECMIYKRKCLEEGSTPVKESFYRFIFNSSSTSVFTFLKNIGVISVNLIRQLSTRIFLAKMLRANRRNTLQTKLQCARSDRQTGMLKTH